MDRRSWMRGLAKVTIGCLAVLSSAQNARADLKSALGFDMGLNMGFASYQASRKQPNDQAWNDHKRAFIDPSLRDAQIALDQLVKNGVIEHSNVIAKTASAYGFPALHDCLARVRGEYEYEIRARSNAVANAYRLGLLLALAEGQSTAPNWWDGPSGLAQKALTEAKGLIGTSSLSEIRFDQGLFQQAVDETNSRTAKGDPHAKMLDLRESWRDAVLVAGSASRSKRLPTPRPGKR
jgi:hypothetical protein